MTTGLSLVMTPATRSRDMTRRSVTRTARNWRKVTLLKNAKRMVVYSNVASGRQENTKFQKFLI